MTSSIEERLRAAEPTGSRPFGGLIERLSSEGRVRGARTEGRAVSPAALAAIAVSGVSFDSRYTRPGDIFVAVPGIHTDGHGFIEMAAARGASVVLVERPVETRAPCMVVDSTQPALATVAAWWYDDPARQLGVVGITGTDGKTTTSFLASAALEAAGIRTGMVGTISTRIGGDEEIHEEHATTPEAPTLQAALRAMVDAGDEAVVLETTSHGLALERVGAIPYDVAVFTNLSHEHLEFHGTWERYRAAKLSLFERLGHPRADPGTRARAWPSAGIVNADDASAAVFMEATRAAGARLITYGTDAAANVRATSVEEDRHGLRVEFAAPSGPGRLDLRLAGRFNAHNALAVVAVGEALGLPADIIRTGLEGVAAIPGRMERIDAGQPFEVIVDYAHSPASLAAVLDVLQPAAAARDGGIIVVFGSGGERDTAKRPVMGRIAGERCRLVVLADEDPRGEDRDAILDEIARGAEAVGRRRGHDLLLIPDRAAAIATAFEHARPSDIVLLAGKGHERSIIGAGGAVPWDESAAARLALRDLGHGSDL